MFMLTGTQRKAYIEYVNQFFELHRKHIHIIGSYEFKLHNDDLRKIFILRLIYKNIKDIRIHDKSLCELCKVISKYSVEEALSILE